MSAPPHVAAGGRISAVVGLIGLLVTTAAGGEPVVVRDAAQLREAARRARPGTRIELAPGEYAGGILLERLVGTAAEPIVIAAQDPADRPVIRGGTSGLQISDPAYLVLEDLLLIGAAGNGLNVDDGGSVDTPAHHVTLRRIEVRDVGPSGNRDGIKLSGVDDLRVEDCVIERWGDGGSGIDMVGCHRVVVVGCTLRGPDPEAPAASPARGSGVQVKGGCEDVTIRASRFENAGSRGVNAGGSTGLEYFRPSIEGAPGPLAEARRVRVLGNTFTGGGAAVAFVGVDGAEVRWNTIHRPGRWALRILQETRDERFVASRGGVVAANLIVFRSDAWAEGGVNVGDGTAPDTFAFEGNAWFCEDAQARTRSLVRTPVPQTDATFGVDPLFRDAARGDLRIGAKSRLRGVGADACPPE